MDISVLCFGFRFPFPLVSVLSICPPGSVILKLESVSINSLKVSIQPLDIQYQLNTEHPFGDRSMNECCCLF